MMPRLFSYSLFLSVVLVSATACSKEEATPPAASFFSVNQDGKTWEPATITTYKAGPFFYLVSNQVAAANQTQELYVGFTVPNLRVPAATQPSVVWTQYTGKTIQNQFLNTQDPNAVRLQITRLDTVQKILEGRLDATLQRSTVYSSQPERMQWSEGSFRVSYRDTILPAHHTGR